MFVCCGFTGALLEVCQEHGWCWVRTHSETWEKSVCERVFGHYGESTACMARTAQRKEFAVTLLPPGSVGIGLQQQDKHIGYLNLAIFMRRCSACTALSADLPTSSSHTVNLTAGGEHQTPQQLSLLECYLSWIWDKRNAESQARKNFGDDCILQLAKRQEKV